MLPWQWRVQGAHLDPPPQFFRFYIQILRNIAVSGVGPPLRGGHPAMGNPGSATITIRKPGQHPVEQQNLCIQIGHFTQDCNRLQKFCVPYEFSTTQEELGPMNSHCTIAIVMSLFL